MNQGCRLQAVRLAGCMFCRLYVMQVAGCRLVRLIVVAADVEQLKLIQWGS
jgi:hypothetical protein